MVIPDKSDKVFGISAIAARSLSRLFAAVLLARICGPELYGVFVLCIAIESVSTALLNACNLAPMLSIGPGLPEDQREAFLRHAARRHVRWSVGFGLAGSAIAMAISTTQLGWLYWTAFALAMIGGSCLNAVRAIQQARFQIRRGFTAEVLGVAVPVLAVALTKTCDPASVLTVYFLTAAIAAGAASVSLLTSWPDHQTAILSMVPPTVRIRFARMGLPMAIGSVANSACSRIHPFVLQAAAGFAAVGTFGVASTTIGPIRMLSMALCSIIRPRLSLLSSQGPNALGLASKICALLAILGAIGVLLCLLVGTQAITWVFGADYAAVGELLPLACIFATLEAIAAVLVVALQVLHEDGPARATRLRIVTSSVALLLVWPACQFAGASGAFTTLCITELMFLWLTVATIQRRRRATNELAIAEA